MLLLFWDRASRGEIRADEQQEDMHISQRYTAPFRKTIPLFLLFFRWYLTADEEHSNNRGSVIVANDLVAGGNWMAKANYLPLQLIRYNNKSRSIIY